MEIKLILTRDVLKTECSWLKEDLNKGDIVFKYNKPTYGAITPNGIACSKGYNIDPFFEVPTDALEPETTDKPFFIIWRNSDKVIVRVQRYGEEQIKKNNITIEKTQKLIEGWKSTEEEPRYPELVTDKKVIEVLEFAGFDRNLETVREEVKNEMKNALSEIKYKLRGCLDEFESI